MAVADVPAEPRIFASISQGWTNLRAHFWILVGFAVLTVVLGAVGNAGEWFPVGSTTAIVLGIVGGLFSLLLMAPLGYGVVQGHLKASRDEAPAWADLKAGFARYGQAVLLALLTVLIVAVGFVLLVIPGIYVMVRIAFAPYRFIQDGVGAVDAIKASFEDTKGRWWRTFGLILMAIPLIVVGALALFVGIFVALPLIHQMFTVYWRSIDAA